MEQHKESANLKEEYAVILDFLPNGYPFDTRPSYKKEPIAQAIGKKHFALLELVPKKEVQLQPAEEVYIGEGKREKIHHIAGKISPRKLTETAKGEIEYIIETIIEKNEERFVGFFNNSTALSTRMHQLELLPGIGKKHMREIIKQREEKPFESFQDIKERVKSIADPKKIIVGRIIMEINEVDRYRLFIR